MAVVVHCSACKNRLAVAPYFAGSMTACNTCGAPVTVPSQRQARHQSVDDAVALEEGEFLTIKNRHRYHAHIVRNERDPSGARRSVVVRRRWSMPMRIAAVVAAITAGSCLVAWALDQAICAAAEGEQPVAAASVP